MMERWKKFSLGEVMTLQRGFDLPSRLRKKGNVPIISSSGISDYHNTVGVTGPGVITGRYGTIGEVFYSESDYWPLNTTLFVSDFNNNDPLFCSYLFKTIDLKEFSGKSGVPGINRNDIHQVEVSIPSQKEQTAIANALSDVDALLTELEKLIAKKQAIKTATMQQLLTGKTRLPQFAFYSKESAEVATYTEGAVEGESQGQPKHSSGTNVNVGACDDGSQSTGMDSRRKGTKPSELGEIPEDWCVTPLGELVNIQSGESPSKFIFKPDGVPYFKVEQLNNGLVYAEETEYRIDTKKVIEAGSIIFPKRGASILLNKIRVLKNKSFMDTNLMTLTCGDKLNNLFLYNILTYKGLDQVADTTSIPQINNKHIIPFLITVPSIEEQTAIATILSDMDNEIQTLEQRLSKTRQIKQGMMQALLTGKTRLPFEKNTATEVCVS